MNRHHSRYLSSGQCGDRNGRCGRPGLEARTIDRGQRTDLFLSEVGNSLWRHIRQGTIPLDEALGRMEEAIALADQIVPSAMLVQEVVAAAARYSHPIYGMLYVRSRPLPGVA